MSQNEDDIKATLAKAMDLIGAQNAEIEMYKSALETASMIQTDQQTELATLQDRIAELEKLLHVSDEGLSEALIVLASIREGLIKVNEASNQTIKSLQDVPTDTSDSTAVPPKMSEDDLMLDEHERYLRDLRDRLTRKS